MVGLLVLGAYALVGVLVAGIFVLRGVSTVDAAAARSGLGFRLVILPGCAALWPMVLGWWWRRSKHASSAAVRP
jgi:hypothetical protein